MIKLLGKEDFPSRNQPGLSIMTPSDMAVLSQHHPNSPPNQLPTGMQERIGSVTA